MNKKLFQKELIQKIELAYYCYLTNFEFREKFVQVGSDAVTAGYEADSIYLLASAENDTKEEIVKVFKEVCSEIAMTLPDENSKDVWMAETSITMIRNGQKPPDYDNSKQLDRYLLMFHEKLKSFQSKNSYINEFVNQIGKFIGVSGMINDYASWVECVEKSALEVSESELNEMTLSIVDLIHAFSYGATGQGHLEIGDLILNKLEQLTKS